MQQCWLIPSLQQNPTLHADNIFEECSIKQYQNNLHVLEKIISTVIFLGRQGLPFRRHRDDCVDLSILQDANKGNFLAFLQHQAITDNILKDHLASAKKNAKYTLKTIQEEII